MPETSLECVLSASPPITVVWPSRMKICVVASRLLITGASNCTSLLALLSVCVTCRLT